jgi:MoaA/NifB/PqqE/SkfB family radical SAM enzyme
MKHRLVTNNALRGLLYREAVRRKATCLPYAPLSVYIDPCNLCNLRCTFCPQSNWGQRERGRMTWDLFERVLSQVVALKPERLMLFCFGESTLHDDLVRMVAAATGAGLRVRIHTNALLLDEAKVRGLVEAGLDECCFSFDTADREHYGRMRIGSDFDRVLGNIRRAVAIRDQMGANRPRFILQELVPYAKGCKAENSQAYLDLFAERRVEFKAKFMHSFAGQSSEENFAGQQAEGDSHCSQLYRRIVVNFDGKVHACCLDPEGYNIVGDLTAGDSLAEAWNSPAMQLLRRRTNAGNVKGLPPCDGCEMLARRPHASPSPLRRSLASLLWQLTKGRGLL